MSKRYQMILIKRRQRRRRQIFILILIALIASGVYIAYAKYGSKPKKATKSQSRIAQNPKKSLKKNFRCASRKLPPKVIPPKEISVIAVGDILFDRQVSSLIDGKGPDEPFRYVSSSLQNSEITVANLECPLSNKGNKLADKDVTFRGRPQAVIGIKISGIDVVSMANNHALDCGPEALQDSIDLLDKNNIGHSGAGMNISEALKPAYFVTGEKKDKKVAFLAFSYMIPPGFYPTEQKAGVAPARPKTELVTNAINEAHKKADFVFCSFHWGTEYEDYPVQYHVDLAHLCIDSGADLVIGHHPHVIQGIELYKGKLIAYSLGDFVFDHYSRKTGETFILECSAN
jgi:poly-gamma-glutamate synthesis protein (capsule biosynthesis protein)